MSRHLYKCDAPTVGTIGRGIKASYDGDVLILERGGCCIAISAYKGEAFVIVCDGNTFRVQPKA